MNDIELVPRVIKFRRVLVEEPSHEHIHEIRSGLADLLKSEAFVKKMSSARKQEFLGKLQDLKRELDADTVPPLEMFDRHITPFVIRNVEEHIAYLRLKLPFLYLLDMGLNWGMNEDECDDGEGGETGENESAEDKEFRENTAKIIREQEDELQQLQAWLEELSPNKR